MFTFIDNSNDYSIWNFLTRKNIVLHFPNESKTCVDLIQTRVRQLVQKVCRLNYTFLISIRSSLCQWYNEFVVTNFIYIRRVCKDYLSWIFSYPSSGPIFLSLWLVLRRILFFENCQYFIVSPQSKQNTLTSE